MVLARRRWCAQVVGVALALALARWWWQTCALQVVGVLALARALAWASALWLAPALPARRLQGAALARRAVLVTGCDSGFGHAAARRLHALGARVFACVLLPHGPGADSLRALASPRMRVLPLDVTDADSVAAAALAVQQDLQDSGCELWAIVNNAGIAKIGESEWMDVDDVKKTLDVNTLGQVRVTQAFLPFLKKSRGRIVNMNSLASKIPIFGLTPYNISKFASLGFTETLRLDASKFSISVHSIEPAIYKTNMVYCSMKEFEEKVQQISDKILMTYCEEYKEKLIKLLSFGLEVSSMPEGKVHQVVEAIEDACLAEDPQDHYFPGNVSKLGETFADILPYCQRILFKIFFR